MTVFLVFKGGSKDFLVFSRGVQGFHKCFLRCSRDFRVFGV